jgi:ketosteroid isomerase-like protein
MKGENIEIVRRGLRRFIAGEDPSLGDMDPGFTLDNSDGVIAPGVYRGLAGVREYRRAMEGPWQEIRFEALEYLAAGEDLVVVPMRLTAVGRDGIETTARTTVVYRIENGRAVSAKAYQEQRDAFAAAGVDR